MMIDLLRGIDACSGIVEWPEGSELIETIARKSGCCQTQFIDALPMGSNIIQIPGTRIVTNLR